jgi:hypothetical protein
MLKADMKQRFNQVDEAKDSQFDAINNKLTGNHKRFDDIDATLRGLDDHLLVNDKRHDDFTKKFDDTNATLKQLM